MSKLITETVAIRGRELEIGFYFYKEEKQTYHDPGWPAYIEFVYINHFGEDISELLSEKIYNEIETKLLEIQKQDDLDWDF